MLSLVRSLVVSFFCQFQDGNESKDAAHRERSSNGVLSRKHVNMCDPGTLLRISNGQDFNPLAILLISFLIVNI